MRSSLKPPPVPGKEQGKERPLGRPLGGPDQKATVGSLSTRGSGMFPGDTGGYIPWTLVRAAIEVRSKKRGGTIRLVGFWDMGVGEQGNQDNLGRIEAGNH